MSRVRMHPAHRSLSKEETKEIYDLTKEIMRQENIGRVPLVFKPKVWATAYIWKRIRVDRAMVKIEDRVQLGGRMLTGSSIPKSIYYISLYDPDYHIYRIAGLRRVMLATIVASVILEELAHAIYARKREWKRAKPHGAGFLSAFRDLWKEYFIIFQFKLQYIYGSEGDTGEGLL